MYQPYKRWEGGDTWEEKTRGFWKVYREKHLQEKRISVPTCGGSGILYGKKNIRKKFGRESRMGSMCDGIW